MTMKTQGLFYADRVSTEDQELPGAYWNVINSLNWIDNLKVFLPVEIQRLISAPIKIDSPVAVDRKHLECATQEAWRWLGVELICAAKSEGYHKFLERHRREVGFIPHRLLFLIELNIV